MPVDIAQKAVEVGNAITSLRLDQMILNLAKGIAWGQYELDKVGVDITKMMGVPGTVSIGDKQLSMLEAGFIPSFYHFVDTILEVKMDVNVREEITDTTSTKLSTNASIEAEAKGGFGWFSGSVKTTAAFSTSKDTTHSQKYNQDLSASSLMRTKLVPVPPPELLLERIKILLEQLREEAKTDNNGSDVGAAFEQSLLEKVKEKLLGKKTEEQTSGNETGGGGT